MHSIFTYADSPESTAEYLAGVIRAKTKEGKRVLWLVSGGSAILPAVETSKQLAEEALDRLTIMLADERFGPLGHKDENWRQLMDAGFAPGRAACVPTLVNADIVATIARFENLLHDALLHKDYRIGLFGIGSDGHTAGILPGSPAVGAKNLVAQYDGGNFQRITVTPEAIAHLDEAVVYAMGSTKKDALLGLNEELSIHDQPAQALKRAGKLTIFTDQDIQVQ